MIGKEGIRSFISMPFKSADRTTGFLQIYFSTSWAFSHDEADFFRTLANEAAAAIENALLFNHVNKRYEELVEDIFLWYDGTNRCMEY